MGKLCGQLKKYKIGLVLSGGGARGFAHLGVLKALEEKNMKPEIISGVSAGAIVGAFYGDGYSPNDILEMFIEKKLFRFVKIIFPKNGFLKPTGLYELIGEYLRAKDFEDLQLPVIIAAANLNQGKIVYFDCGEIADKIIASSSIPVLFEPVKIKNQTYVDGGVFDNLPVKPLVGKCETIIGVNVNPLYEDNQLKGMIKLAERTFYLNIIAHVQEHMHECDLFIELLDLKGYGIFEISKAREMFEIGYKATIRILGDL